MSLATLARLKDELVGLYGEEQIAMFVMKTAREQVNEWFKGGTIKIHNKLWFGKSDPNNPTAVADYSVTIAELLLRLGPAGQQAKSVRSRLIVFAYTLWENVYRPAISQECGVDPLGSDAFGDLRQYRSAILHQKGKLDNDTRA